MHVRVGFSDYKPLIHAATDNPFLLYYDTSRPPNSNRSSTLNGSDVNIGLAEASLSSRSGDSLLITGISLSLIGL